MRKIRCPNCNDWFDPHGRYVKDRFEDETVQLKARIADLEAENERLRKEVDDANGTADAYAAAWEEAEAHVVVLHAENKRYRALASHLPEGFAIGDDATAELAVDLTAAEARVAELEAAEPTKGDER